jgi:hypothetical protein
MQFIAKAILSIPLLYALLFIWTHEIDVGKTLGQVTSWIKTSKSSTISVDFKNILIARAAMEGLESNNYVIVLYRMTFINTSDDNVTVQKIFLRCQLDGKDEDIDRMMIVNTGIITDAPQGPTVTLRIVAKQPLEYPGFHNLMGWKNIGTVIGENKLLLPGGVIVVSAVFRLEHDLKEFTRIKKLQIVAVDYKGKEVTQDIPIQNSWFEAAPHLALENRPFTMDKSENIKFLD